jgi:hypothetical protein
VEEAEERAGALLSLLEPFSLSLAGHIARPQPHTTAPSVHLRFWAHLLLCLLVSPTRSTLASSPFSRQCISVPKFPALNLYQIPFSTAPHKVSPPCDAPGRGGEVLEGGTADARAKDTGRSHPEFQRLGVESWGWGRLRQLRKREQ